MRMTIGQKQKEEVMPAESRCAEVGEWSDRWGCTLHYAGSASCQRPMQHRTGNPTRKRPGVSWEFSKVLQISLPDTDETLLLCAEPDTGACSRNCRNGSIARVQFARLKDRDASAVTRCAPEPNALSVARADAHWPRPQLNRAPTTCRFTPSPTPASQTTPTPRASPPDRPPPAAAPAPMSACVRRSTARAARRC